jgi:CheY-like chemotaxis protein
MGGDECIGKLRQLDPNVTAVLSSGYANAPVIAQYRDYGFDYALPKPFQARELNLLLTKIMKK